MSRRNGPALQALGLLSASVACMACPSCRRESRQAVVLYCSVDQAVAEPIIAAFEKQSGIAVQARFDTEASKTVGLVRKIEAEANRPAADVFWSNEIFYTIRLARKGLLQPYRGGETADWPADLADEQGRWYGFALRARVIAYNTRKVTAAEAPKTLEELLAARWRGRIAMARPIAGTTVGDVSSWFVHYGAERAKQILAGLAANRVRLVDGNSLAVRAVAQGEADVCLTDTDDVYAAQRNGWPVAMHPLDQGGAGCLVIPNTVGLVRGGAERRHRPEADGVPAEPDGRADAGRERLAQHAGPRGPGGDIRPLRHPEAAAHRLRQGGRRSAAGGRVGGGDPS